MSNEDADDPQIKDTYAHFGLAMYWANVLELALVQTLLQIDFLKSVRENHAGGKKADRRQLDAAFDVFMQKQYDKMMGTLALKASKCGEFSAELKGRISAAVKRRNFLAHRYWREIWRELYDRGRSHKNDRGIVERCEYI